MKKLVFIITIIIVVLCSCDLFGPDCSSADPKYPIVYLYFVDSSDNPLIGPDNRYHPDLVQLFTFKDTLDIIYEDYGNRRRLYFYYWNSPDIDTYYLKLDHNDIDTIELFCHTETGECFDNRVIDSLKFNSSLLNHDTDNETYKIVK